MQHSTCIQVYPNRELRLGWSGQLVRKRRGADTAKAKDEERYHKHISNVLDYSTEELSGIGDKPIYLLKKAGMEHSDLLTQEEYQVACDQRSRSLDIIKKFQDDAKSIHPRHYPKSSLGTVNRKRRFGNAQRREILRTGAAVSRDYSEPGQTWEVTLTLPGDTDAAKRCLASHTPWMMNRLMQVVRDADTDSPAEWFYVWEWQKRGALHLHLALAHHDAGFVKRLAHKIEAQWWKLLQELSTDTGIDMFAKNGFWTWKDSPDKWQSHVAEIEKNLAAYFAKYASKEKDSDINKYQIKYYPKTWWGRSRTIARKVLEQTVVMRRNYQSKAPAIELAMWIEDVIAPYPYIRKYEYEYEVKPGNEIFAYGWRQIRYYEDDIFESIKEEVNVIASYLKLEAINNEWSGRINNDIACQTDSALQVDCV